MSHRRLINALKQACPLLTIRVKIVNLPSKPKKLYGDCLRMEDHYRIRIRKQATYQEQWDTIIHEFAHAEAYLEYENGVEHGPMFGVAFARLYSIAINLDG